MWLTVFAAVVAAAAGGWLLLHEQTRGDDAATLTAAPADNIETLAAYLQGVPRDARAWAIFARLNIARGDFAQAEAAFSHALALPGRVSQDPMLWCEYADVLAIGSGGRFAGKPSAAIMHALTLNPHHPRALEMAGSAAIERGDYIDALRHWEQLLQQLPVDSAQYGELLKAIERVRLRAGL